VGGEIFPIHPDQPWGPSSLQFNGYRGSCQAVSGRSTIWPLTPSSAWIKNEWSYAITFPICLHGMDRWNFTLQRILSKISGMAL